jgi:type IV secretory pathway TrbL component
MNGQGEIFNQENLKDLAKFLKILLGEDLFNQFSLENWNIEKIKKIMRAKEEFDSVSESLKYSVREMWKLLPSISALSAMLLIIATFNKELIPLTFSVKLLLTILLILIPIGLWSAYLDLSKTIDFSFKAIEKIVRENLGKDISNQTKKIRKPTPLSIMPLFINIIFSLIVLLIIFLIWNIDLIKILIDIII